MPRSRKSSFIADEKSVENLLGYQRRRLKDTESPEEEAG
jgi:hypothetical protein